MKRITPSRYLKELNSQKLLTRDFNFPDIMAYKRGRYYKMTEVQEIEMEIKQIALPEIDLKKYIGKKAKIESVKTFEHPQHGPYVQVASDLLDTIEGGSKNIEIRATMAFGLHQDKEGTWGWGEKTKLGKLLKEFGVTHPNELVGRDITCQIGKRKDGRDRLEFVKG